MQEEYINKRLNEQIVWYDKKSQINKRMFYGMRTIELFCASIIPFIAGIGPDLPHYQIIIGTLGVIIAISSGMLTLFKFHENWITYRTTVETLKHEKYLFVTHSRPYNGDDSFDNFVHSIEELISKENSKWLKYVSHLKSK